MRDSDGGGGGGDTSIDETALGSFVDTSERLAGELSTRLGELEDLDRRVRNLSTDFAVGWNPLSEATTLAVRWATAAATVERIRTGAIAADRFVPDDAITVVSQPADPDAGLDLGRLIQPVDADEGLDLGRQIQLGEPEGSSGVVIQTLDPDLGLGVEIQTGDDQLSLQDLAGRNRRKPAAQTEPVPTGPVARPTDPYALVPVHGRLYPAHQVTFWPTGKTAPAGPDGKPQPLYTTKLLGEGGPHVDNFTYIDTVDGRTWHLDLENPSPGQRPGQLHLQYKIKGRTVRHMYDFNTGRFLASRDGDLVPRWMEKEISRLPQFADAVEEAEGSLNVPPRQP
ncbi:MAG: hypothetical protein R2761_10795 [Acidimicrobiales bacterium]